MIVQRGMGALFTVPFSGADHPAKLDVFADAGSIAHITAGFLAGFIPAPYEVATLAVFTGYQVSQAETGESWQRTGGEFIEFAIGILLAKLVQVGMRGRL